MDTDSTTPPASPPAGSADAPADWGDVDSIDGIVNALYDSVSFERGQTPSWARFRGLFEPQALLVRLDPRPGEAPRISSIDEYIGRTTVAVESGALEAFTERELTRRTEVFADLAQVFSTYERSASAGELRRGINSLQLIKHDGRWWVVSITWTDESDDNLVPSRYLPRA